MPRSRSCGTAPAVATREFCVLHERAVGHMGHWFQMSSYMPKDARRARWALSRAQRQLTVAQLGSRQCRLWRQSRRQKAMMPQPRWAHLASLSRGRPSGLVCRRRPSAIYARLGVVRRRSATSRHACCSVFWHLDKSRAIPTQGAPTFKVPLPPLWLDFSEHVALLLCLSAVHKKYTI